MASKVYLLVKKSEFHKENIKYNFIFLSKSRILLIDETMIVT